MAKHRSTEQKLVDAEERAKTLRKKAKARDTRRKILIGSMYQSQAEKSGKTQVLLQQLDRWLPSGHRDRNLWFDHGIGSIRGLMSGTQLYPVSPGWSFGTQLAVLASPFTDKYGNVMV
jgi:hypothetical protein